MKNIFLILCAGIALNVNAQIKIGSNPTMINSNANLDVEATTSSRFIVTKDSSKVGVGTLTPAAKLDVIGKVKITDGTQAAGKVLISDATGLASWQTPVAALSSIEPWYSTSTNTGATSNTESIYQMGNVGIGTATPAYKLTGYGTVAFPDVASLTVSGPYKALGINSSTGQIGTFTPGALPVFAQSTLTESPLLSTGSTVSARIPLTTNPNVISNTAGIVSGQDIGINLSDGSTGATMDYFQVPTAGTYRFEVSGTIACNSVPLASAGSFLGLNVNMWKASSGTTSYSILDDYRAFSGILNITHPINPAVFVLNLVAGDKVCFRFYIATTSGGGTYTDCGFKAPTAGNQSYTSRVLITKL